MDAFLVFLVVEFPSFVDLLFVPWEHFRPSPNIRGNIPNRAAPKKPEPSKYRSNSKPSGSTPQGGNYGQQGRGGRPGDRRADPSKPNKKVTYTSL